MKYTESYGEVIVDLYQHISQESTYTDKLSTKTPPELDELDVKFNGNEGDYLVSNGDNTYDYITCDEDSLGAAEIYKFIKMLNPEQSDVPFWEQPAFDESDFKIIDGQIQWNDDVMKDSKPQHITHFFQQFLKPMVDNYIANHPKEEEYPNGDGIDAYERAMNLLK